MIFDFTTGGLFQTADSESKTFLVDPKINFDSAFSFAKGSSNKQQTSPRMVRSDKLARWRDDRGPIGRAIRSGDIDRLREAINSVRKQKGF